jgi:hypothetical protein
MSHLLNKSEENKNIAHFLHTSVASCYPASVHCGYYSCLQKIIHLFDEYFEMSYDTIVENVKGGKGGVHGYYIKEVGGQLLRFNKKDAQNIRNDLKHLKILRLKADYNNEEITEDSAKKAFEYTEKIHKIIKKHFQL